MFTPILHNYKSVKPKRKLNKTSKGNRRELEARKQLKSEGYLVEKKNSSRWESNDFWGLFDILAIRPDGSEIRLIQIKSNISDFYKARKEITEWMRFNGISDIDCEIWLKENRKPWRKEKL